MFRTNFDGSQIDTTAIDPEYDPKLQEEARIAAIIAAGGDPDSVQGGTSDEGGTNTTSGAGGLDGGTSGAGDSDGRTSEEEGSDSGAGDSSGGSNEEETAETVIKKKMKEAEK